jgi:hypothetical protein
MAFEAHLKRNLLLVFINDGDGQTEAYDNEIDRRARCGERRDPTPLTTTLISDRGTARAGNALRFSHGSDGVICERLKILRVFAFRAAGPAFVIDEGADILGW